MREISRNVPGPLVANMLEVRPQIDLVRQSIRRLFEREQDDFGNAIG